MSESGDSLRKKDSRDRRLQLELGCSEQRQAGVRLLVGPDDMLPHQLPEIMVVFLAPKAFLKNLKGYHILVRSDSMMVVAYINNQGGLRSHPLNRVARRLLLWALQPPFSEGSACAGQAEPESRRAVPKQGISRGMETPPPVDSDDLEYLQASGSGPLCLGEEHPKFFSKEKTRYPTSGPICACMPLASVKRVGDFALSLRHD